MKKKKKLLSSTWMKHSHNYFFAAEPLFQFVPWNLTSSSWFQVTDGRTAAIYPPSRYSRGFYIERLERLQRKDERPGDGGVKCAMYICAEVFKEGVVITEYFSQLAHTTGSFIRRADWYFVFSSRASFLPLSLFFYLASYLRPEPEGAVPRKRHARLA